MSGLGPNESAVRELLAQLSELGDDRWNTVVDRLAEASITRNTQDAADRLASGTAADQETGEAVKELLPRVSEAVTAACGDRYEESVAKRLGGVANIGLLTAAGLVARGSQGEAMELQMEPLLAGVTGTGVEAAREYAGRLPTLPASAWDAVAAEVELAAALQSATAEAVPFTGEEGPWRFQAALGLVTAVAYRDRLSAAGLAEAGKLFEGIVEPLTAGSPTA